MFEEIETTHKLNEEGKLHRRLRIRIAIFIAIIVTFGALGLYDFLTKKISIQAELGVVCVSFILGIVIFSKMAKVTWDAKKEVMNIENLDITGFVILILYIIFRIQSKIYLEHTYDNIAIVTGLTFSSIFAGMLGRLIGIFVLIHETKNGATGGKKNYK
jgi:hypothetical protein